jgi:hypothetical protein
MSPVTLFKPSAISICAFGAGGIASQALYESLVVPRLPGVPSVAAYWWLVVTAPEVVAITVLAALIRSRLSFMLAGLFGGVTRHVLQTVLAREGRPGHFKSFALEAPPSWWWTTGLTTSVAVALFAIGAAIVGLAFIRGLFRLGDGPRNPGCADESSVRSHARS